MTDEITKATENLKLTSMSQSSLHARHHAPSVVTYKGRGEFLMPNFHQGRLEDAGATIRSIYIKANKDLEAFLAEFGQPPLSASEVFRYRKRRRGRCDSEVKGVGKKEKTEENIGKNKRVKRVADGDKVAGDAFGSKGHRRS